MKPQYIPSSNGIFNVTETNDLHKTLEELNKDVIDSDEFSTIDMRTRLTPSQIPSLVGLDVLCLSGCYPKTFMRIGRSVKRMAISVHGKGRKEFVEVSKGVNSDNTTESINQSQGKSIIERSNQNG